MTKFEENGVQKQDEAWLVGYADKAFAYSCYCCSSRNLDCKRHGCDNCPIAVAHAKAIKEITSGKRERPSNKSNYGATRFHSKHGKTEVYYNFNVTINMNTINNNMKENKDK